MRLLSDATLTRYGAWTKTSSVGGRAAPSRLRVRLGRLPALRVGQEELHDVGAALGGGAERVVVADVGPDAHGCEE